MTSVVSGVKQKIKRLPWKEYLKSQLYKVIGFLVVAALLIGVMIISDQITDLDIWNYDDAYYVLAIILSSLCFIIVLLGFSKIVLFDMADEFGLRNKQTNKIDYNLRFFLFASLSLSFCSSIYLLLDVFLQDTYLELLLVIIVGLIIDFAEIDFPGLTDIGTGREFYQTIRNGFFGFFFLVMVLFSVIVFLTILTSLARRRAISYFKKEEDTKTVEEEEENKTLYKVLLWLFTPIMIIFSLTMSSSPIGPLFVLIAIIFAIWWLYQLVKVIVLVLWKGMKITAFVTSINALLIIPLVFVLYVLPLLVWMFVDTFTYINSNPSVYNFNDIIFLMTSSLQARTFDLLSIAQLDFVFITAIATFVVGFAEGFAIVAIFTAIYKGYEVAKTGQIIAQSPPKVIVISKYLLLLSIWLSMVWDSFLDIWTMLIEQFNFALPEIHIPSFFFAIYYDVIIPLSEWINEIIPNFHYVVLLLIPLYFIFSSSFKFLSVTIITPKVKDRLSIFFLLISTAFVLIVTNILGDIYAIQDSPNFVGIKDAPLKTLILSEILVSAVDIFQYIEAIAFYSGFIFGIIFILRKIFESEEELTTVTSEKVTTTKSMSKEEKLENSSETNTSQNQPTADQFETDQPFSDRE